MKIKKGDNVKIIAGKDKNKIGKVIKILPRKSKALVHGLNLYKKHVKPKTQGEKGQTVAVPRPIDASNIMIVCDKCNKTTRIGYRIEDGNKARYCKRCKARIA